MLVLGCGLQLLFQRQTFFIRTPRLTGCGALRHGQRVGMQLVAHGNLLFELATLLGHPLAQPPALGEPAKAGGADQQRHSQACAC
ncbi:hypothetical protein RU08_13280 [Pseudomonas fulva]|uniref:Uncharacterized protein n=1 Tax=Pseudomonas fulva TaxID=47880 RepID=A0A0D0KS69_9PSED|nr:hypothetical protein RU08_13280 [Pseudomonas fulva]